MKGASRGDNMKERMKVPALISIFCIIAAMSVSFIHASIHENNSMVKYQTWEEFVDSGVQIEYGETSPAIIDDEN